MVAEPRRALRKPQYIAKLPPTRRLAFEETEAKLLLRGYYLTDVPGDGDCGIHAAMLCYMVRGASLGSRYVGARPVMIAHNFGNRHGLPKFRSCASESGGTPAAGRSQAQ
jgi:hypothetical protein